jgi:hypothetical protein
MGRKEHGPSSNTGLYARVGTGVTVGLGDGVGVFVGANVAVLVGVSVTSTASVFEHADVNPNSIKINTVRMMVFRSIMFTVFLP